jgi:hypothetical protein
MGTGTVPSSGPGVAAVVQNVTVTGTSAPGWVSTYPAGGSLPLVSTLNFVGPNQTRAALAFTKSSAAGTSYSSLVPTDLVVDVIGTFSS